MVFPMKKYIHSTGDPRQCNLKNTLLPVLLQSEVVYHLFLSDWDPQLIYRDII